jgi:hypothetical protein
MVPGTPRRLGKRLARLVPSCFGRLFPLSLCRSLSLSVGPRWVLRGILEGLDRLLRGKDEGFRVRVVEERFQHLAGARAEEDHSLMPSMGVFVPFRSVVPGHAVADDVAGADVSDLSRASPGVPKNLQHGGYGWLEVRERRSEVCLGHALDGRGFLGGGATMLQASD